MMRADEVLPAGGWTGEPADSVVLDFDERYCRRSAMTGVGGLAFQLDLKEAAMLRGGDALRLEDGRIVEIVAAPEPLYEIRATDPLVLLRVALSLGNFHAPAEVTARALRVRRDPEVEEAAKALGARVTPVEAPFNPEGAAYVLAEAAAHEHDHGHAHDHGHHHAHDHGHDHGQAHDHPHHDHDHHDRGHDHHHEGGAEHVHHGDDRLHRH